MAFVDERGNIVINGVAFATAGPIASPFTTSTAGQMGAVAGHLAAQYLNPTSDPSLTAATIEASRLIGGIAAAIAGGDERAIYIAAGAASNAVENNRILHPDDRARARALALQSGGLYSEEELLAAMRWSNQRNSDGSVSQATQQVYDGRSGFAIGAGSPIGSIAGDLSYDPGLVVARQGTTLTETLPPAPSSGVMNFIVQNTGGANSPYAFNASGMRYGPSVAGQANPQYFDCATTTCVMYGANRNPNNPVNQAQDQRQINALGATGIVLGAPAAVAYAAPALMAAGVTAQTAPLTGGVAGVTAGRWFLSAGVGFVLGGLFEYGLNTDATPLDRRALGTWIVCAALAAPVSPLFGLAVLWDFTKAKRKADADAKAGANEL